MNIDGKVFKRAAMRHKTEIHARELKQNRILDELSVKIPRIAEIDIELKQLGIRMVEVCLNGINVEGKIESIKRRSKALIAERGALLEQNALPKDLLDLKYYCDKCEDSGYANAQVCTCLLDIYKKEQANELSNLFSLASGRLDLDLSIFSGDTDERLGMPPRALIDNVIELVKAFTQRLGYDSKNLYLRGDGSADKAEFAAYIARGAIEKGLFTVYMPAFSFFRTLEDERFNRGEEAHEEAERFYKCDLLILDELGTEQTTAYASAVLFNIISKRFADKKVTVITSDINNEDLAVRYSPQIAYRISESYTQVYIPGKS